MTRAKCLHGRFAFLPLSSLGFDPETRILLPGGVGLNTAANPKRNSAKRGIDAWHTMFFLTWQVFLQKLSAFLIWVDGWGTFPKFKHPHGGGPNPSRARRGLSAP